MVSKDVIGTFFFSTQRKHKKHRWNTILTMIVIFVAIIFYWFLTRVGIAMGAHPLLSFAIAITVTSFPVNIFATILFSLWKYPKEKNYDADYDPEQDE